MAQHNRFRVPEEILLVPPKIIELAREFPAITCNLRQSQTNDRRKKLERSTDNATEWSVSPAIVQMFRKAKKVEGVFPIRMVILTQGMLIPDDVGTVVLDVYGVQWDSECSDYLGFIFDHPTEVGTHILWGGYILAFARINKRRVMTQAEIGEGLFMKLAFECEKLLPKEGTAKWTEDIL